MVWHVNPGWWVAPTAGATLGLWRPDCAWGENVSADQARRIRESSHDPADVIEEWWAGELATPAARRMLVGAIELFAERGYQGTTTRDLVARAGVTTGALYAHYRSKEHLLYEVCLVGHQRALHALHEAKASVNSPESQLAAMVQTFAAFHAQHHMIAKIVHYELYSLSDTHFTRVAELRHATQHLVDDVLRCGHEAGNFTVPDIHGTGRAVLSLCIDIARWYYYDNKLTPAELGELYAELAHRMVGAR